MWLRSRADQHVAIEELGMDVWFASGEMLHTEVSAKFRRDGIEAELQEAGLAPVAWWTDPRENFAVSLSTRI